MKAPVQNMRIYMNRRFREMTLEGSRLDGKEKREGSDMKAA